MIGLKRLLELAGRNSKQEEESRMTQGNTQHFTSCSIFKFLSEGIHVRLQPLVLEKCYVIAGVVIAVAVLVLLAVAFRVWKRRRSILVEVQAGRDQERAVTVKPPDIEKRIPDDPLHMDVNVPEDSLDVKMTEPECPPGSKVTDLEKPIDVKVTAPVGMLYPKANSYGRPLPKIVGEDVPLEATGKVLNTPDKKLRLEAKHEKYSTPKPLPPHQVWPMVEDDGHISRDSLETTSRLVDTKKCPTEEIHDTEWIDDPDIVCKEVKVFTMPRDGDSLYHALAHQLKGARVGSVFHQVDAIILRSELLQQVSLDKDRYRELILQSVAFHGPRYVRLQTDEKKLQQYLVDVRQPRFPPGDEVLQAAVDVKNGDLLVLRKDRLPLRFRSGTGPGSRVLVIKRQLEKDDDFHPRRYHYDSIKHGCLSWSS